MDRRAALRALLMVSAASIATRAARADAGPPMVTIDNFSFTPQTLTVPKGRTVTWINRDDIPHQVICQGAKAVSHPLDTDDRFSFTFNEPGRFGYFCGLHPHMTGTVVVTG